MLRITDVVGICLVLLVASPAPRAWADGWVSANLSANPNPYSTGQTVGLDVGVSSNLPDSCDENGTYWYRYLYVAVSGSDGYSDDALEYLDCHGGSAFEVFSFTDWRPPSPAQNVEYQAYVEIYYYDTSMESWQYLQGSDSQLVYGYGCQETTPSSETSPASQVSHNSNDDYRTTSLFAGQLFGGNFAGREVSEIDGGGGLDSCSNDGSYSSPFSPSLTVTGDSWGVAGDNTYRWDSIGWLENPVAYYQAIRYVLNRGVCEFRHNQTMYIQNACDFGQTAYKNNILQGQIYSSQGGDSRVRNIRGDSGGGVADDITWPPGAPSFAGEWYYNGLPCYVQVNAAGVVIGVLNEWGDQQFAYVQRISGVQHIEVPGWGDLDGLITGSEIQWSNGTTWYR